MTAKKAKRVHVYKKGYGAGYKAGYKKTKKRKAEKKALSMYRQLLKKQTRSLNPRYRSVRTRLRYPRFHRSSKYWNPSRKVY